MKKEKQGFTLYLPPGLHTQIKRDAAQRYMTMNRVIVEALEKIFSDKSSTA